MRFELNDGNHRFEVFQWLGVTEHPVILWCAPEVPEPLLNWYGRMMR